MGGSRAPLRLSIRGDALRDLPGAHETPLGSKHAHSGVLEDACARRYRGTRGGKMKARRGGTGSGGPSVSPSAATSDPARYRPRSGRRSRRARATARRDAPRRRPGRTHGRRVRRGDRMKNDEGNGRTRRAGTRTALRRLLRHDLRQRRHRARRVDRKRGGDAIPRPRRRSVGSAPAPRGTCLHVPTQRRGRDPNMQKCCGQLVGVEHFVSKGGEGENERENAIRSRVVDHWPPVAFPIDRSRRSGLKGSFFGHGRARVSANGAS